MVLSDLDKYQGQEDLSHNLQRLHPLEGVFEHGPGSVLQTGTSSDTSPRVMITSCFQRSPAPLLVSSRRQQQKNLRGCCLTT